MHSVTVTLFILFIYLFIDQSTSRWYNKNIAKTGKRAAMWNKWLTQGSATYV